MSKLDGISCRKKDVMPSGRFSQRRGGLGGFSGGEQGGVSASGQGGDGGGGAGARWVCGGEGGCAI